MTMQIFSTKQKMLESRSKGAFQQPFDVRKQGLVIGYLCLAVLLTAAVRLVLKASLSFSGQIHS